MNQIDEEDTPRDIATDLQELLDAVELMHPEEARNALKLPDLAEAMEPPS